MTGELRTTCNRDCPDSCGIVATVENGRIVAHRGDPAHGVTRGFLCYRGNHYLQRFYSPDRLLHPQRRTRGGWQRLTWDEALDLAAEKLVESRDLYGPRSVLYVSYSGIKGLVEKLRARKFWAHFGGATSVRGGLSVEAAHHAQALDFGRDCTPAPEDLAHSAGIAVWGKNVAVTRVHCWPFIKQARQRGAQLFVVDPVRCDTARKADHHLAIRPGSDAMLAIGVARRLFAEQAIDEEFVADHCAGFEAYRELVHSVSPDEIRAATDLGDDQIDELARHYATVKPLATMIGLGPSYWRDSGRTVRLIDALAAITGNIGIPGGGVHTDIDGTTGLDLSSFQDLPSVESRQLLLPRLGDEILSMTDPALHVGWVAGANPAATCPHTERVLQGLQSLDFLVVVEQFMTATAELADLILPCASYLEMEDLITAYGHNWLSLSREVVPPLGEVRVDGEIFRALAERLGFGEHLDGEPRRWIESFLQPLAEHGVTYEELLRGPQLNPLADPVPCADRRFGTSSGKFELIGDAAARDHGTGGERLRLMATKTLKMVNAQINAEDLASEPVVRLHPDTVAAQGLVDGGEVMVESATGQVRARLRVDPHVRRDVLLFNPAAWQGDLQGVNQLRESALTDIGEVAAMHETVVTVRSLTAADQPV